MKHQKLIFTDKPVRKNSYMVVHLVDDKEIQRINKEQRGKDYPTDVLSFEIDANDPDGRYYVGDVIVNIDQAKRQMKKYGNDDVRLEIADLVAHGVLHLLGVNHEGEDH